MGIFDKLTGNNGQSSTQGPAVTSDSPPPPATGNVTVKSADVHVRLGFLRKVYSMLTINLLITIGLSLIFAYVDPIREYVVANNWIIFVAIGVTLVTLLALVCIRIKFPANLVLLYIFVGAFSTVIASIVAIYFEAGMGGVVLKAFIATAAVFLTITAYVGITKKDFSFLYGFLWAGLVVLIVLSLITFLLGLTGNYNKWLSFGVSVLGYVTMLSIFCFLIVSLFKFHPISNLLN